MATVKKCSKNKKLDDAHQNELIKQSENRSKIGQFLMIVIIVVIVILLFLCLFHVYFLVQDPIKLEYALVSIYAEIKNYVIPVGGTLMLGNKLR